LWRAKIVAKIWDELEKIMKTMFLSELTQFEQINHEIHRPVCT
jgi:hypothetical protein